MGVRLYNPILQSQVSPSLPPQARGKLSGPGPTHPRASGATARLHSREGEEKLEGVGGHSLKQNRNANVGTAEKPPAVQCRAPGGNVSGGLRNLHPGLKINRPLVTLFLPLTGRGPSQK